MSVNFTHLKSLSSFFLLFESTVTIVDLVVFISNRYHRRHDRLNSLFRFRSQSCFYVIKNNRYHIIRSSEILSRRWTIWNFWRDYWATSKLCLQSEFRCCHWFLRLCKQFSQILSLHTSSNRNQELQKIEWAQRHDREFYQSSTWVDSHSSFELQMTIVHQLQANWSKVWKIENLNILRTKKSTETLSFFASELFFLRDSTSSIIWLQQDSRYR